MSRAVPIAIVVSLLITACGGGSDNADSTSTTSEPAVEASVSTDAPVTTPAPAPATTEPMVFDGATVVVANGNIVGGSAGRMTDALALAGFTTGDAVNGSEKIDASIVYYSAADGAQEVAETLATKLGGVDVEALPAEAPTEDGTLVGGQVLLLLGNDEADKSLDELSGPAATGDDADDTDDTDNAAEADADDADDADDTEDVQAVENDGSAVVVANANTIGGSAGRMSEQLEDAGFTVGTPTNSTAQASESVVYYANEAAQGDADALAAALGGLTVLALPDDVPTESGSLDGDVLLVLGSAEADKSLASLAG